MKLDETHDPALASWVASASAPGCEFPIQNLPFGIFRRRGSKEPARGGVAIGNQILDLAAFGLRTGPSLNGLAASGRAALRKVRREISRALREGSTQRKRLMKYLLPMKQAELLLPVTIGDYSDFYAGIHHAMNIGRLLRPDNPLLPNYKWVPIGYHGRSSSVVASGTPIRRPRGQIKPPDAGQPTYAASARLDYEAELGFIVGTGNRLGRPIPVADALDHVFGAVLLNDWSARDIQAWEYQPLGPFLAKSFATTVSPWIVTMDALEPYRCPAFARAADDPAPLPYLADPEDEREGGYNIDVEMHLRSTNAKGPVRLSRGSFRDAYWTVSQMVAHQSCNGCNLQTGDLLGSGTLSGAAADSLGSLMELTLAGKKPVLLPDGETRTFLQDGDEVTERGRCTREGFATIGFGAATGRILAALAE
jgi:fumarylacetoacetase